MKLAVQPRLRSTSAEGQIEVDGSVYYIKWPMRNYKAQPAKTTEAKPARQVRAKTLTVKEA